MFGGTLGSGLGQEPNLKRFFHWFFQKIINQSNPFKFKVPLASLARANSLVPTVTAVGFQRVDIALEAPVPLIAIGAVTVMVSILLTKSLLKAIACVFHTSVPVKLDDNSLIFP